MNMITMVSVNRNDKTIIYLLAVDLSGPTTSSKRPKDPCLELDQHEHVMMLDPSANLDTPPLYSIETTRKKER